MEGMLIFMKLQPQNVFIFCSLQLSIAFTDVSKSTVFNCIYCVTSAVIRRMHQLISWPDDAECRRKIAQNFFNLSIPGVPFVAGALDGSLIEIIAPSVDEVQFVDRHQNHSINAMGVAGY